MKKFNDLSPQYKYQIVMTGLRKCPACGGKPSPRSPKRGYCDKHIEARAAWKRKSLGCKRKFVAKDVWVQLDWTLGPKLMAAMLGVRVETVKLRYKRLVATGRIKAVPGFMPGRKRKSCV
jgi:hypothetical protein